MKNVHDWSNSLDKLKKNGIIGRKTKDGIKIEFEGKTYTVSLTGKFPKELKKFKKDIQAVFLSDEANKEGKPKEEKTTKIKYFQY